MHRLYANDDISVFWDSDKCFHAKKCVTGRHSRAGGQERGQSDPDMFICP